MGKSPNRAVAGSKRIGVKQQKNKGMLQAGRIEQRVGWSKTAEKQENAPSQKN